MPLLDNAICPIASFLWRHLRSNLVSIRGAQERNQYILRSLNSVKVSITYEGSRHRKCVMGWFSRLLHHNDARFCSRIAHHGIRIGSG